MLGRGKKYFFRFQRGDFVDIEIRDFKIYGYKVKIFYFCFKFYGLLYFFEQCQGIDIVRMQQFIVNKSYGKVIINKFIDFEG